MPIHSLHTATIKFSRSEIHAGSVLRSLLLWLFLLPTNPKLLDRLVVSLALNGDPDGAIEQLQKAIPVDPGSVEYRFNLAYMFESRGDFAGATPPLERAIAPSRSKDWRCLAELAKVYDKTGRTAEAIPPGASGC